MATMTEKKSNVNTPCSAYADVEERYRLVTALMGGTTAMRAEGENYLPQYPKETRERYKDRLKVSVLYEAFSSTVRNLSGRPFGQSVQLSEDSNGWYDDMVSDIDAQGTDMTVFARSCLEDILVYGKCHILAEYPNTYELQEQLGRPITRADEVQQNIRPYLVRLSPRDVIGWRTERQGGQEVITRLRYRVNKTMPSADSDWEDKQRKCVVVWTPETITVHEQTEEGDWVAGAPSVNTLGMIPVCTVYANRVGPMMAHPPLEALAHLNQKHWKNQSDQDQIEEVARIPMLHMTGYDPKEVQTLEVAAYKIVANRNPQAQMQVVETNGSAVTVGQESLKELVQQMEDMALEALRRRSSGSKTATEVALQVGRNVSDLEAYCVLLEKGLAKSLYYMSLWSGLRIEYPTVKISTDFGFSYGAEKELAEIREDYKLGVITADRYLFERKRRGLYSEEMDIDEEIEEAMAQTADIFDDGQEAGE